MPETIDAFRPRNSAIRAWSDAWSDSRFRRAVLITLGALVIALGAMTRFLAWVDLRPGVVLPDPVLAVITPRDVTWVTFALIYSGILGGIWNLLPHPRRLMHGLQAYVVMTLLRMVVMSVMPLEAPPGMIVLQDPLVQVFGTDHPFAKDLFFSGHTSMMFLLALMAPGRLTRSYFLLCTACVAVCVLWQHVHYTIDVLAAPLFAFASYALVAWFQGGSRPAAP
jgi:hypothetical protein